MIDINLKEEMEQEFINGNYDKALELSEKLDIQILQEMKKESQELPKRLNCCKNCISST